jgi:hypothetical protein
MKTNFRSILPALIRLFAVAVPVAVLVCEYPRNTVAQSSTQITQVNLAGGNINLVWTGNSNAAYQIQSTADLTASNWSTVLYVSRTNAALSTAAPLAFFRVAPPSTNFTSIVLNVTNTATGDSITFTQVPQTNGDLVFDGPTNYSGSLNLQMIFPATELQKFDIALDDQGDFTLVTNALPIGWAGYITGFPGPGANQYSFSGYATNYSGVFTFSAVTDTDEGGVLGGLVGAMCWIYCEPGFAAQGLGCASACVSTGIVCAFQIKGPSCNFVTYIDASGILTNSIQCNANCSNYCK